MSEILDSGQKKNLPHFQKPFTVDSEQADERISSSCEVIKQRGAYPLFPRSEDEENFPIAFIRVVYRVN